MAIQHRSRRAVRDVKLSLFTVSGVVRSPDCPVHGGYLATTRVRLTPIYSPDPAILRLELVLDWEPRTAPDPHHAQLARPAFYQENPASEASKAYTHVNVREQGETIAAIAVRDWAKKQCASACHARTGQRAVCKKGYRGSGTWLIPQGSPRWVSSPPTRHAQPCC
jgi:hypothetical protein